MIGVQSGAELLFDVATGPGVVLGDDIEEVHRDCLHQYAKVGVIR